MKSEDQDFPGVAGVAANQPQGQRHRVATAKPGRRSHPSLKYDCPKLQYSSVDLEYCRVKVERVADKAIVNHANIPQITIGILRPN
jgi:hypothetical protein